MLGNKIFCCIKKKHRAIYIILIAATNRVKSAKKLTLLIITKSPLQAPVPLRPMLDRKFQACL